MTGVGAAVAVLGARMVLEKSLDLQSTGAILQADVKQFYDCLDPKRCATHMIELGGDARLAAAAVRHQVAPEVRVRAGAHTAAVGDRTRGALTGSRVAGALGRAAIRDIMRAVSAAGAARAFAPPPHSVIVASYVDNLVFAGKDASSVEALYTLADAHAGSSWGLEIPRSSVEIVVPRGSEVAPSLFPARPSTKFLGHIVSGDG